MRILITGIAGFLGSHLADRLLQKNHTVVGIDNLDGGELKNVNKHVEFYIADCKNLDLMKKITKDVEIVFHAACTPYDGLSVFSPCYIVENTLQNTLSVLTASIHNSVKRFIYCSSMSRYGDLGNKYLTEDLDCKPANPYGIAKYSSEKIIESLCALYGMEYVILVPHNIIGPRQCYVDPYRNVAAIMINRILQNKPPIIYGDGEQVRCFSFIDDVVDCFERSIIVNESINKEIINVGPDEEVVTINELNETICNLMQVSFSPIYLKDRPLEVKHAFCSSDKARKLLNYKTKINLKQGLNDMIDYITQEGPKEFIYNRPIEILNSTTPITWSQKIM